MKLPSMQWYPGDWLRDTGVSALSYHDQGVWFRMLMLMFECEPRGKLVLNGKAIPTEALSRMLNLDNQILTTTVNQILTFGVASVEPDTGIIFCRRMIRDEKLRSIRAESGKKGGNPRLLNQNPTTGVKQKSTTGVKVLPTPSSSSSSSIQEKACARNDHQNGKHEHEAPDLTFDFELLWTCYPKKGRTRRIACENMYSQLLGHLTGAELERRKTEIHAPIDVGGKWLQSAKWANGYVQNLETYLAQQQWREDPESDGEASRNAIEDSWARPD